MSQPLTSTSDTGPPGRPVPRSALPSEPKPYKPGFAERLYLPLLGGMVVTMRHFLKNLFNPSRMYTISYPEERRDYSHRFRGHHILTTRPDGSVRCVACFLCAQACPAECIHIEAGEHPDVNIEKYPDGLRDRHAALRLLRLLRRRLPGGGHHHVEQLRHGLLHREQSIVGKADLMKPYTFDENRSATGRAFPRRTSSAPRCAATPSTSSRRPSRPRSARPTRPRTRRASVRALDGAAPRPLHLW